MESRRNSTVTRYSNLTENDSLTDTLNKNLRILETGGHKLVKHEIQIS